MNTGWVVDYVARSEILQRLQGYLLEGLSDESIGRHFGISGEGIWRLRTRYKWIREGECPECGSKEYVKGKPCPNSRCLTNWTKPV